LCIWLFVRGEKIKGVGEQVVMRASGPERKEITDDWRKLCTEN
jgi:hypothetical protein